MGIFRKKEEDKKNRKRPDICLSLPNDTLEGIAMEIREFGEDCQIVEWCVDGFLGVESLTREDFVEKLMQVKKMAQGKKLIVDFKGDEVTGNRILRWSMELADMVDIDINNGQIERLIREAKRKHTKVILSYHNFENMLTKEEISETFLRLERKGGDILKVACFAKDEMDTYCLLEGSAHYTQLTRHKPIVAIAMGEEGQVSRICAGDFGSVMSYASGSQPTAPGQFNVKQLKKYMDKYYKDKK